MRGQYRAGCWLAARRLVPVAADGTPRINVPIGPSRRLRHSDRLPHAASPPPRRMLKELGGSGFWGCRCRPWIAIHALTFYSVQMPREL